MYTVYLLLLYYIVLSVPSFYYWYLIRWVDLTDRAPPVALTLSTVRFTSDPTRNLLPGPVIVTKVLHTPTIIDNPDRIIYQTATKELRIKATGLVGAKRTDLMFQPPSTKEVAYEDVTHYPISSNSTEIILRLRYGYSWRDSPGPLLITGVNTGGGFVKVINHNDDIGVAV